MAAYCKQANTSVIQPTEVHLALWLGYNYKVGTDQTKFQDILQQQQGQP